MAKWETEEGTEITVATFGDIDLYLRPGIQFNKKCWLLSCEGLPYDLPIKGKDLLERKKYAVMELQKILQGALTELSEGYE